MLFVSRIPQTFSTHPLLNIVFDVKMGQLHGKYVLNKRDIEYLSKHTQMTREDVQSKPRLPDISMFM